MGMWGGQWKLWARSANSTEIAVVKTTVIAESHRKTLKHDYLHRFNRLRVDLVVWILIFRAIPDAVHRMEAISRGEFRILKLYGERYSRNSGRRRAAKWLILRN